VADFIKSINAPRRGKGKRGKGKGNPKDKSRGLKTDTLGLAASGLGTNMIFFSMGFTQGQESV
jgi:hypothetical protein